MKFYYYLFFASFYLATSAYSQKKSVSAADLEAKLRQTLENSDEGARILIKLVDLYSEEGQVFGLVRAGKIFSTAQAGHPKHEEMMGKLIDGLAVASQNSDLKASILQYLERYPKSKKAPEVHRMVAQIYERENQRRNAADHYRMSWEKRGGRDGGFRDAEKAFSIYRDLRSQVTAELMGQMALRLMDQLPAGAGASEFGIQAFHQTRSYGGQYQLSNQIAKRIFEKKLPLTSKQAWDIQHHVGDNFRSQRQYANSIKPYQEAIKLGSDSTYTYRNLIGSLSEIQAKPREIEEVVNQFIRKFPNESKQSVAEQIVHLANAKHRSGDVPGAISSLRDALKISAYRSYHLFSWTGDEKDWDTAVRVYQECKKANADDIWKFHYEMAFHHLRSRKKDDRAAVSLLESELLYKNPLPNAGSSFGTALRYVLEKAPSEKAFQAAVQKHVASAKQNGHDQSYAKALESWLNTYKKNRDPEIRKRYDYANREYDKLRKDATMRLWVSALQNRMKGHHARGQLFKTKLSQEQKLKLFKLHAHDIRHYGDQRRRNEANAYYKEIAKLESKSYPAARSWVETAAHHGTAQEAVEALEHVLTLDQSYEDHSGWYYVSLAARKSNKPEMMEKAMKWIRRHQAKAVHKNGYAGSIAGNLRHFKMEKEEAAFLREVASREPDHSDTRGGVLALGGMEPEGEARIKFFKKYLDPVSDGYSEYASRIADEYLKLNDFANFEKVCREAIKVRETRRLKHWSFSLHDWVSRAMRSKEWTSEQKVVVYQVCRDLEVGRESAYGNLALLELNGHTMKPIDRLLAYRNVTLQAPNDGNSHLGLMSWGQKAVGRKEYAEAAALSTGILANIKNVGVDYQVRARSLIREAYGKMGALGMEVSADNPMAPLLEIGVHLKLGDQERALTAYQDNRGLFDEFMLELPAELVAFAADSHIAGGGEANQERAETVLRKWIVKHSESEKFTPAEKAKMQLLLARNYNRAKRYEVARSEYTTVVNRYSDTEQAVEARFGIGETYMSQKIFDKAEESFAELSNSSVARVRIRGMFLLGVLESRKGNTDDARKIFKEVLGSMPDVSLANETLFNLSEVYRGEQRYLEQLGLLRTVGRLGQQSKRWHQPGRALSIVVQDSDLGISRGHTRIPVVVTTLPGGDSEWVYLSSGGAGKGLFMGEVETTLGEAREGNGLLEVGGADLVKVDYPEDFKSQFQFEPISTGEIGLASDADFKMASRVIVEDPEKESETERMMREEMADVVDTRRSEQRPDNQIKPGNHIYLQVKDLDRDTSNSADEVLVKLTASSGDEVQAVLKETGTHSGVFDGSILTSDLPAGALATDTAIEHSPLMAIDQDESSAWISQPDGVTPKYLSVDLKELEPVTKGTFATPDPLTQAPVRARLQGSHDGRYWYPLAEYPPRPVVEKPKGGSQRMTRRVWHLKGQRYDEWKQVQRLGTIAPHETEEVDELAYSTEMPLDPEARRRYKPTSGAVIFQGGFIQQRDGAIRLGLRADRVAVMVNGFLAQPLVKVEREHTLDLYLEAGIHDLMVFAYTNDTVRNPISVTRSRENPNSSQVRLARFNSEDFDLKQSFVSGLKAVTDYPLGSMNVNDTGVWQFEIAPRELRHVRFVIDEYLGQSVAINHVTISGPEKKYIPTEANLLELSNNNKLEITPGDQITSVYIDQLPTGGQPRNRALEQKLRATYYDGKIETIGYDFVRQGNGQVQEFEKDLLRIDPGERIILKITDYDMDSTGQQDRVPVKLQVGDGKVHELVATETESTSGVFKVEVDTQAKDAEGDHLLINPGEKVYVTYRDQENTFPGHAIDRSSVILVREPTDGKMRVMETRFTSATQEGRGGSAQYLSESKAEVKPVAYEVPLTIEVFDEDAARDSRSTVIVAVELKDAPEGTKPVEVACVISSQFSEQTGMNSDLENPALHRGRFVGQVTLKLGDNDSPRIVPVESVQRGSAIGRVLAPMDDESEERPPIEPGMMGVLNIMGGDQVKITYVDNDTPSGEPGTHTDQAVMRGNASLMATDISYEKPIEKLQVGERLFLRLSDPDGDRSSERDKVEVSVSSPNGEREMVALEETLSHSGVFTGSFKLKAINKPVPGNVEATNPTLEVFFGEALDVVYSDATPSDRDEAVEHKVSVPISDGTDGEVAAFTKSFGNEDLAIQTQFHIAESYFELFKSHLKLGRKEEADLDLENGRRILRELREDYPNPKYTPRVTYLLGQYAQELKSWEEAIDAYETIVNDYPDHTLAADAQYKLGQCYEEAKRLDEALEAYVTLAATYPQNPLISNVMIRINDHFYQKEDFEVAAQVGSRFLERFENHEWAPRMAFRVGQCFYKDESYKKAGEAFDDFVKRFPEDDLTAQALFWSGESYRQDNGNQIAFQRYNRCRWDFPESDAAKYARGRLALPEMIQQFEREAQSVEMDQ